MNTDSHGLRKEKKQIHLCESVVKKGEAEGVIP